MGSRSDKDTIKKFSKNVRLKRHAKELTQLELAEIIGCHINYCGLLERGQVDPTLTMLVKIARALETTIDDLLR